MELSETASIPPIESLSIRLPEIPRDAFVPMVVLSDVEHPERAISGRIQDEAQRAALATMIMLGVDISKYRRYYD